MRNRSFATLGTLALLTAASAFGQQRLAVDIPFEFSFANTVMPAGHYNMTLSANDNLLLLECSTCGIHVGSLTTQTEGGGIRKKTEGHLVFNKYGDAYFLALVWAPGSASGTSVNKSGTERKMACMTPRVTRITIPARTGVVTSSGF